MKKFIRLFLIFIFCITSLCGCGNDSDSCSPLDVSKHSAINTDYSATVPSENDAVADEGSSDDDDMIYITSVEKTHNYYPIIKNATFNSDNIEFYKIKGSYFQMICSYKELQKIIVTPSNIDPVIFEENYIICISRSAGIGYYDFKYENGKYSISADSYSQYNHGGKPEISEVFTSQSIDFIIVPKTEVEYIDGFQELCVNRFQKNGRQLDFIEYDTAAALPNKAQVWKLTSGSDLIEEYGLTFNDINVEYNNSVLVFLPDEPTSDF